MADPPHTGERTGTAQRSLTRYGLATLDVGECRLHVIGWDCRLLRRRLAVVLGGIDDLREEWDATAELATYLYDRRVARDGAVDLVEVVAEVEDVMRGCVPLPHTAPRVDDVASLLTLTDFAEDAYEQLLGEHLDYAENAITARANERGAA